LVGDGTDVLGYANPLTNPNPGPVTNVLAGNANVRFETGISGAAMQRHNGLLNRYYGGGTNYGISTVDLWSGTRASGAQTHAALSTCYFTTMPTITVAMP
jgi:hypothetical protein